MKILPTSIDRHDWATLGKDGFRRRYLLPMQPVILSGAIDHWKAKDKWTPDFFRQHYAARNVKVDDKEWQLGELIERIVNSSPQQPAPYLRNELLERWPGDLREDIAPMPACTQPNWLEHWAFPSRDRQTFVELYIGGAGARFPVLHYDGLHTHAFLMQLYGEKEYLTLAPDQEQFVYPRESQPNVSNIDDIEHADPQRFPLFEQARGIRFRLLPGETLFVPAGWWHTARIVSTSITVSINGANVPNWPAFTRDYCAQIGRRSKLKANLLLPYMTLLGGLLSGGG
jgi:histone arginine demethylase JMJD6